MNILLLTVILSVSKAITFKVLVISTHLAHYHLSLQTTSILITFAPQTRMQGIETK